MDLIIEYKELILAVSGAIGGALLTLFTQYILGKRAYDLRLWEKIIDKRIEAHLQVIEVATDLRIMFPVEGEISDDDGPARAPQILNCKEDFDRWWYEKFGPLVTRYSPWLSTKTKREINFLQDYLVTLHLHINRIPSDRCVKVGVMLRQDFIDLSSKLEKTAYSFFEGDIRKLKLAKLSDWHKYKKKYTIDRLSQTLLARKLEEINSLAVS